MSWPIPNFMVIKSSKKTFKQIAELIDKNDRESHTNFDAFIPEPKDLDVQTLINWHEENWGCAWDGLYLTIDEKEQTIWYETNSDPSDKVVAAIAKKFPDARIEYGYEKADDDEHDIFDVYSNGILVSHEDKIVTWNEEDENEEEE